MKKLFSQIKEFIPQSIKCLQSGYSLAIFKKDLGAGITVGIISIPFSFAAAIGAGIPPEKGIYTSIIGGFLVSLFGGSRAQISGATSTFIALVVDSMQRNGANGTIVVTLLGGIILIIFAFAKLGTFMKYIPHPVAAGLTTGIAVLIFSGQIKDFLGLQISSIPVDFIEKWKTYYDYLWTWDIRAFAIGMFTLLIICYLKKTKPKFPSAVIALIAGSILTIILKIDIPTVGSRFGCLSNSLPKMSFPFFDLKMLMVLIPDAITLALLVSIESLLSGVVSEGATGWKYSPNGELFAQGIANVGSAVFGGIPCAGSVSRTMANIQAGAITPISGIVSAASIASILFFLGPLTSKIPLCALSAVLITISWSMSDIEHFFRLFTAPKKDVLILITVFLLTVFINVASAIQVGMMLAAFLFMKQMSDLSDVISSAQPIDPKTSFGNDNNKDPENLSKHVIPNGVAIYEINGPFFFGVSDRLKNVLKEIQSTNLIFILRMQKVPTVDASGMHALEEFYYACEKQGTVLLLSGVKKGPLNDLKRYHLDELIGSAHIFSNLEIALEFATELLKLENRKLENNSLTDV